MRKDRSEGACQYLGYQHLMIKRKLQRLFLFSSSFFLSPLSYSRLLFSLRFLVRRRRRLHRRHLPLFPSILNSNADCVSNALSTGCSVLSTFTLFDVLALRLLVSIKCTDHVVDGDKTTCCHRSAQQTQKFP